MSRRGFTRFPGRVRSWFLPCGKETPRASSLAHYLPNPLGLYGNVWGPFLIMAVQLFSLLLIRAQMANSTAATVAAPEARLTGTLTLSIDGSMRLPRVRAVLSRGRQPLPRRELLA